MELGALKEKVRVVRASGPKLGLRGVRTVRRPWEASGRGLQRR